MSDSSGMIVVVFLVILIAAGGGVAAWYFLVYKPGLGPAPAPAYVAPPITYTVPPPSTPLPPSSPPPSDDDDYDPLSLGEVVSPAGSPSAAFSIALWRIQMKKKYSKKLDVLKKRLEVLEDAKEAEKEMSGTVPSEYFDDAITYLKNLIKKAPKAAPPKTKKAPFDFAKWKTAAEKKKIDDVQQSIDQLKAAKKAGAASEKGIPRARYDDAIKWLETILKKKEKTFDIAKWKIQVKKDLQGMPAGVIREAIDLYTAARNEKKMSFDGVPRSKYPEAIAWLKVLEKEKKFNFAKWKADSQKKLAKKSKSVIQRAIDKAKTEVPRENRPAAVRFLEGLKAKAKK
jgi:hypothetical protein